MLKNFSKFSGLWLERSFHIQTKWKSFTEKKKKLGKWRKENKMEESRSKEQRREKDLCKLFEQLSFKWRSGGSNSRRKELYTSMSCSVSLFLNSPLPNDVMKVKLVNLHSPFHFSIFRVVLIFVHKSSFRCMRRGTMGRGKGSERTTEG